MRISLLLIFCWSFIHLFAQTGYSEIDAAIATGEFNRAQGLIKERIATDSLSAKAVYDLQFQSDLLDRIRQDFSQTEAEVRETLAGYYPELSDEQLAAWEASNELEMRRIDGEKRYFYNAVWNLFRINKAAGQRREEVDGPRSQTLDSFLQVYLPLTVQAARTKGQHLVNPKRARITYTLRVRPNAVPAGETIRAWLPYPRTDRDRLTDVKLLSVNSDQPIIAPLDYPHTSIYLEKTAVADEWTVFTYQAEYTAHDAWYNLADRKIQTYNTASDLYRTYTAERATHVRFTPEIKALSAKIIGQETDPLRKTWLIFDWIGRNIPWASALEYSTMPNIPTYCLANGHGDCGMKSLLFITLCRYNGIPAKWQSGWFLYPVSKNLHDWAEVYFEGVGWVPVDPDFNVQDIDDNTDAQRFFLGGADAYRLIVNNDFSGAFFPAKIHPRSETVDFQRGEVEWRGGNLYFDQWRYRMEVEWK